MIVHCSAASTVDGNGSQASPRFRLREAMQQVVPSTDEKNSVLLERGYCYDPYGGIWPAIYNMRNFTLASYGEGANPVLDSLVYESKDVDASTWTLEGICTGPDGGYYWSKRFTTDAFPSNQKPVKRVMAGAYNNGRRISDRFGGIPLRRGKKTITDTLGSISANLSKADPWWSGHSALSNKLYMWTPTNDVAPPEYYNGLSMLTVDSSVANGTAKGASALIINGSQNVLIMGIDSWGSNTVGFHVYAQSANPMHCKNIEIFQCNVKYSFTGGISVQTRAEDRADLARGLIDGVYIHSCIGDTCTSIGEQEPNDTEYGNLGGAMDMFTAYDNVRNVRFADCDSINSFHVAFAMGAYNFNSAIPENCGFENCRMFAAEWHTYARGLTTYNCASSCYVRNCLFDGQNVRSQIAGAPLITGNFWINNRVSTRKAKVSGWLSIAAEVLIREWSNVGNEKYVYTVVNGARIIHNYVEDMPDTPNADALVNFETFQTYGAAPVAPGIPDGAVTIANNIIVDRLRSATYWVSVEDRLTPIGAQTIENNVFWRGKGRAITNARYLKNGTQTLKTLAEMPGHAGNLTIDPMVSYDKVKGFQISRKSPCRRAGKWKGHAKDMAGNPFMFPPTIGPKEFTGSMAIN